MATLRYLTDLMFCAVLRYNCKSLKKFEIKNNILLYPTNKGLYVIENYFTRF